MVSKDVTRIALAGTAVCGLLVLFYFWKKRSISKAGAKSNEEVKTDNVVPLPKPVDSKTPEKLPVKTASAKSEGNLSQDVPKVSPVVQDTKAGGESVTNTEFQSKKQAHNAKDHDTKSHDNQTSGIPKPLDANFNNDSQRIPDTMKTEETTSSRETEVSRKSPQNLQPVAETMVSSNEQVTSMTAPAESSDKGVAEVEEEQKDNDDRNTVTSQATIVFGSPNNSEKVENNTEITNPTENGHEPTNSEPQSGTEAENTLENGTNSAEVENGHDDTQAPAPLNVERITKAMQQAKTSPANMEPESIKTLVELLKQKDQDLLQASLDCIVRCGAFTQNQTMLRESGCIQELTLLLEIHAVAARTGVKASQNLLGSINNAIINLCMDIQNQARLEVCIPVLIDLITYEQSPDDVQLMALKSLTNLSTTPSYHEQYINAIPRLIAMMDSMNSSLRLQAVKVLVNLSCNPEIIPDLLSSKGPSSLLKCLQPQTDSILLLRVVTLLVNLISCVKDGKLNEESLPSVENPAAPDSMHSMLFGEGNSEQLKTKIQGLTRHSTENVSKQANRLFNYMKL